MDLFRCGVDLLMDIFRCNVACPPKTPVSPHASSQYLPVMSTRKPLGLKTQLCSRVLSRYTYWGGTAEYGRNLRILNITARNSAPTEKRVRYKAAGFAPSQHGHVTKSSSSASRVDRRTRQRDGTAWKLRVDVQVEITYLKYHDVFVFQMILPRR